MRIFLLGFMGSGKSHVGRELAALLKCPFHDLDARIEARAGCAVSEIFATRGEAAFRQMERDALRQLPDEEWSVVATGGGTPCFHDNMDWMNARGLTVFLDASPALLARRLFPERHKRPLIAHLNDMPALTAFIESELNQRRPFYEQAHLTVQILHDDMPVARHLFVYLGPYRNWEE